MSIKLVSIKCPECGASLDVEEDRQQVFCSYCGTKIMLQNENEYVYRHIDEAKIKQIESKERIKMKQLEMEEKKRKAEKLEWLWILLFMVVMIILGLLCEVLSIGLPLWTVFSFFKRLFGG